MTVESYIATAATIILALQFATLFAILALNARTKFPSSRAGGHPQHDHLGLHSLNEPPKNTARPSLSDGTILYRKTK